MSSASEFEKRVHENMELNRHYLTPAALMELETHMSNELNGSYKFPDVLKQGMLVEDIYSDGQ